MIKQKIEVDDPKPKRKYTRKQKLPKSNSSDEGKTLYDMASPLKIPNSNNHNVQTLLTKIKNNKQKNKEEDELGIPRVKASQDGKTVSENSFRIEHDENDKDDTKYHNAKLKTSSSQTDIKTLLEKIKKQKEEQ